MDPCSSVETSGRFTSVAWGSILPGVLNPARCTQPSQMCSTPHSATPCDRCTDWHSAPRSRPHAHKHAYAHTHPRARVCANASMDRHAALHISQCATVARTHTLLRCSVPGCSMQRAREQDATCKIGPTACEMQHTMLAMQHATTCAAAVPRVALGRRLRRRVPREADQASLPGHTHTHARTHALTHTHTRAHTHLATHPATCGARSGAPRRLSHSLAGSGLGRDMRHTMPHTTHTHMQCSIQRTTSSP